MNPERMATLSSVLASRAACAHLVLENLSDPHNAAACLRTADVLGVQHVHIVQSHSPFIPVERAAIENIREEAVKGFTGRGRVGAATSPAAMGSAKWLTLHTHPTIMHAYEHLQQRGVAIMASSLGDAAAPLGSALCTALPQALLQEPPPTPPEGYGAGRCTHPSAAQVALVFGNERRGTSKFARDACDQLWFLPQRGLAQSLNVGVALGIACDSMMRHLHSIGSIRLHETQGSVDSWRGSHSGGSADVGAAEDELPGTLHADEREIQLATWLLRDVRSADSILRRHGLQLQQW